VGGGSGNGVGGCGSGGTGAGGGPGHGSGGLGVSRLFRTTTSDMSMSAVGSIFFARPCEARRFTAFGPW
jgi:hypothetical protein